MTDLCNCLYISIDPQFLSGLMLVCTHLQYLFTPLILLKSIYLLLWTISIFFNLDLLHARLNSNYTAWSYKKKNKKIKAYRKSV